MKTIIKITNDYMSENSHNEFISNIDSIINDGIEVFCEIKNNRMTNIVEEQKNYIFNKEDAKNKTVVEAKGYSQSEWQTYILHHNAEESNNDLQLLVEELKKSFTHMNDYWVVKFEQIEIDGKKFNGDPQDFTSFCIRHIEYPDKEDVLKEYVEIYGEDFDEYIIKID
tara:strand:- start:2357 stop:2860 length:504 start_codon:yes stop_codon:yes gene_type:complete